MKLRSAAKAFDSVTLQDAYSGLPACVGQFDLFDDSRRDAYGVDRRILSFAPSQVLPPRRVLRAPGTSEVWLVGTSQTDYYRGRPIRRKHVLQRASGAAQCWPLSQVLEAAPSLTAFATAVWVKDVKLTEEGSAPPGFYQVYFSSAETLTVNTLVQAEGRDLWAVGAYLSTGGFNVLECLDVTGCRQSLTFEDRVYVAASDSYVTTPLSVPAVVLVWKALYQNSSEAALGFQPGDRIALVKKADVPTVSVGDSVVGAVRYQVHAVEDAGLNWQMLLRVV